ncbi:monocarboxylate transporter [Plakobranchus ocellatus]|uniref:Monocarboxylate transporter n=1 Tax=Plakobranchus ocellatus TaxID=259542 RepID=A0AAV3Z5D9_9GAST|nr:monocarboxylate transporter [Plakobranchus ocellatus]
MGEANPNHANGMDSKHKIFIEDNEDDRWNEIKDRGYAWVIAFASFFAFALCGGFAGCDGIYYVMFMARYKSSARLTAWLGAIASTLHAFCAPLATMLRNRFSVRTAVILGVSLSSLGYIFTSFATNIYWLFITYSICQGLARALTMTSLFLCLSMYFDKRYGQIIAFATCGTDLGTLCILPLTQWLMDTYDFEVGKIPI